MKKELKVKKRFWKLLGKTVRLEEKKIDSAWPPICNGFFHQPKRPMN